MGPGLHRGSDRRVALADLASIATSAVTDGFEFEGKCGRLLECRYRRDAFQKDALAIELTGGVNK